MLNAQSDNYFTALDKTAPLFIALHVMFPPHSLGLPIILFFSMSEHRWPVIFYLNTVRKNRHISMSMLDFRMKAKPYPGQIVK